MEKQLIEDIKQILIQAKYCDIVASKNNLPQTAKELEGFRVDAEQFYLTSPRFHHIVDLQIAAIQQIIEDYGVNTTKMHDFALEDRKRADLMNQRQIIEQARLNSQDKILGTSTNKT